MFLDINEELTAAKVTQIIQKFCTGERIRMKRYQNYYDGKQDIIYKTVNDASKPCNRIITNYCASIVDNYSGYLTGIDITYRSNEDISNIQEVLAYNDVRGVDAAILRDMLIYGRAFEVCYLDEESKQRFKKLDALECIPVYDNTLNQELRAVIRFYPVDSLDALKGYYIEVYDDVSIKRYKSNETYASMQPIEEIPHYYKQVPITVYSLNEKETSIFDRIMSLQDAYNTLLSSGVDDFESFCDAYLVLKGITAEAEDIAAMKENRALILDADSDASFLTKNISDAQLQNLLDNIDAQIHKLSNSPDFNDSAFATTSGVALRYKLIGFENTASGIVANMTKGLQRRLELISTVLNIVDEAAWRDVDIVFTRNLPTDDLTIAQTINQLRGVVSTRTLLSLLPFVRDVDKELEALNEDTSSYNFEEMSGNEQ